MKRGFAVATVLVAAVSVAAGCTSAEVASTRPPVSDVPVSAALRCPASTTGVASAALSWQDIWPNAGGGGASLRVQDLRPCTPSSSVRPASFPLCKLGFPWRPAATVDADLAALGVIEVRLKHLVKSSDVAVDETILSFAGVGPGSAGAARLVKESIGCGQGAATRPGNDANSTRWLITQSGSRLALVEAGSRLVAVEFADPSLKQAQLQRVVDKAVNLSARLG